MPKVKWLNQPEPQANDAPAIETPALPPAGTRLSREATEALVADGTLDPEAGRALLAVYDREQAAAAERAKPATTAEAPATNAAASRDAAPEPYVLRPLRPDEQAKIEYVLRQAMRAPNVPLDFAALEQEISADDHMAGLTRFIRAGYDFSGAKMQWEIHWRRVRQPRQRTAAEIATHDEIKRSNDALRRSRNRNWQPPATVAVEPSAEVVKLRSAVETATGNLTEAEERVETVKAAVARLGRDAVFDMPGAKGRLAQATGDLAKARDLADAARATLDGLRAELAAAENDADGIVRARRLQEAQTLAREYVEACGRIDGALRTMNDDVPRVDVIVQQLESYRGDLGIFWPQSGRLMGDTRLDAAVAFAGPNVQRMLGRDHVPVGRRKSLRQMAEAAFAALLGTATPQAE